MNRRLMFRRLGQIAAVAICVSPLLYSLSLPKRVLCKKELLVQLDRLSDGEYQLGIFGDAYVNHCQIAVSRGSNLSVACEKSQDVHYLAPAGRVYFPVRSAR